MSRTNDNSKFHNLRFRPFLLITVTLTPKKNVNTSRKGWMTPQNLSIQEHPQIVDRVSDRHLRKCAIIIDIANKKVIKNQLRSVERDNEIADKQTVDHYVEKYADQIRRVMV